MTGNWNHGIVASGGIVDTNATVVVNGGTATGSQAYGAFAIGEAVSQFGPSTIFLRPGSSITNHHGDHGIGLFSLNSPQGTSIIDSYATVRHRRRRSGLRCAGAGRRAYPPAWRLGNDHRHPKSRFVFIRRGSLIVADAAFGGVQTSGDTSHGALAQGGVIELNGTTILTTGAGAHGILAEPNGGQGGRVYPTGATDPAVATGDVTVIFNGNVTASGEWSHGIFANASTAGNAYVETSSAVLGGWGVERGRPRPRASDSMG